jgi:hypothetical protein
MSIDSLPDDLLLRALAPLPLLRRLRASTVCRRFKRLLYTPALRASLRRAHMLPQGESLAPGGAPLASPNGRVHFAFQTDGNAALCCATVGAPGAPGADGTAVRALRTDAYNFAPDRLALLAVAGALVAFDVHGRARWCSSPHNATEAGFAPPLRLVVRDAGDAAILDADDAEVWVAVPERRPARPGMDDDAAGLRLTVWTCR